MVEEEFTQDEICKPRRPGHVIFPELRNITSAISLCSKMRARVSVADSAKSQNQMTKVYKETFKVHESEGKV